VSVLRILREPTPPTKQSVLLMLTLVITILSVAPNVHADQQYAIDLLGFGWTIGEIPIEIHNASAVQQDLVLKAANAWNTAQTWFRDNYDPQDKIYQFTVKQVGLVKVEFGLPVGAFSFLPCYECAGVTLVTLPSPYVVINNLDYSSCHCQLSSTEKEVTWLGAIMHELGHVLGLGHTKVSDDLMNEYIDTDLAAIKPSIVYPTTLDLYGVDVIAQHSQSSQEYRNLVPGTGTTSWCYTNVDCYIPDQASLPPSILYAISPTTSRLEIQVPPDVSVTVDGVRQPPGPVQLSVALGAHTATVPEYQNVDPATRLKFHLWNGTEGTISSADLTYTFQLFTDVSITASYDTQYRLNLVSSQENATGVGWYDAGSVASFSVSSSRNLLFWTFQGWYEDGRQVGNTTMGSITMNSPHTLTARWVLDYVLLGGVIGIIAVVAVGLAYYRKKLSLLASE
jgi:hypothetical protein